MMALGPASYRYISQRLNLHYVDWGNPDAPPLLLIHGGQDHCRNWDWIAENLSQDYHVIAPDLCGHGDSDWAPAGNYSLMSYVYDIAQLIHQLGLEPLNIVSHSMGGAISLRYTGLYPESVRRLAVIEGTGLPIEMQQLLEKKSVCELWREWVDKKRVASGRSHRKYESVEEALARMQEANAYLTEAQARHLTIHGVSQNEDGTYSWKFDNYTRFMAPNGFLDNEVMALYQAIDCPTLLFWGEESWAPNPLEDGRASYFKQADVKTYAKAGHWLHHDQTDRFIADIRAFLK